MSSATESQGRFTRAKLTIAVHDLAGYTRAAREADDLALAAFLDDYYVLVDREVKRADGRVVKFIGDAVLMVFPEDASAKAVDAMQAIRRGAHDLARSHRIAVRSGNANVHLATVAHGEFGPASERRYDVLGTGVNHTFLMGARQGEGVHISEPVYRQLPNERRSTWRKDRPPAVYSHE